MISFIEAVLQENWGVWFPERPFIRLRYAKIAGNSLLSGRVVFLGFPPNADFPLLVVKFPRTNHYVGLIEQEFLALQKINTVWPQATTPKPLWFGDMGFTKASMETAVVGRLIGNMRSPWLSDQSSTTREIVRQHLEMAFGWLSTFHKQTTTAYTRFAQETWLSKTNNLNSQHTECLNWINVQLSKQLTNHPLPLICEHGDFWAGNLYIQSDQQIGVIDWVDAAWDQLPLFDAAFFITSYALGFTPVSDDSLWMFKQLLNSQSWLAIISQTVLRQYFQEIGIPDIDLSILIGLALLRRVQAEAKLPFRNNTYSRMLDYWYQSVVEEKNGNKHLPG